MDYKQISQRDKRAVLEHAVLTKSPEEISAVYRKLGHVENSARALGLACRFRGLEYVEALVGGGADFTYKRPEGEGGYFTLYYWLSPLEMNNTLHMACFLDRRDACFTNVVSAGDRSLSVLPVEQRVEIVKYLYENREKVCLDAGELLYYAIMSGSKRIARTLKAFGVTFSERRVTEITENGRSFEWQEFCSMSDSLGDGEYLETLGGIVGELGGKRLHYTDSVYWGNYSVYHKRFRLYKPEIFRFILEHFNQKKMNKAKLMKGAIDQNSVACLEICAENGWLAVPRKRDEMIAYASGIDKTECCAWLLEYKNRTADFAAEREKAEKKMMRELNANPNSVTELKKIWGYEKREDGTLVITRFRGSHTEVDVPEKIGNGIVTEIGVRAFSPIALRLKEEQTELRRSITRITLPKTIRAIGESAFQSCQSLVQIDVPDSVVEIGARAFWGCKRLRAIELPEGITEIGNGTF
ncbi:MAG: leucine-rich repeat domain-containing protein, partial [Lachnospiraceae bacterium]|nr:leucine-rich repeat domain-containing protein [Lachnospiraceae bacterium]